jgi:AraC-like DNA-binding protein
MEGNSYRLALRIAGDLSVFGNRLGPRILKDYEIVYFPEGTGTIYTAKGIAHKLDKPCIVITRKGEEHDYRFDPDRPTRHLYIHFDILTETKELRSMPFVLQMECAPLLFTEDEVLLPNLIRHILKLARNKPFGWVQRSERLLQVAIEEMDGILAERSLLVATPLEPPPAITKVQEYIENNLHQRIAIESLAQLCGWSHEHFSRAFRKWIGLSPQSFIMNRKIAKACQLLKHPEYTIKQISYMLGFETPTYFYRLFRRLQGMTASEFRHKYADPRLSYLFPGAPVEFYQVNRKFKYPTMH